MKTYKHILAAAALTVLTACTSEDNTTETPKEPGIPITLSYTISDITPETRAAQNLNEGYLDAGVPVWVRITKYPDKVRANYIYTTAANGVMIPPTPAPEYPTDEGSTIDINAWYPCSEETALDDLTTPYLDFTVKTDQTSEAGYKASDLIVGITGKVTASSDPLAVTFQHCMSKINVNITPGTGISEITAVRILNVKPTCKANIAARSTQDATGESTSITMSNHGAALIPTQTISGDLLAIDTDKGTVTYTLANPKRFLWNNQYTLNLTVSDSNTPQNIGTTNVITGWTDDGTAIVYTLQQEEPALTVRNVTADHVGWLIAGDGSVYENYAAVTAAGKTPVALICYVGEPGTADGNSLYNRGLAIALGDANGGEGMYLCEKGYADHSQWILHKWYSVNRHDEASIQHIGSGQADDPLNDIYGYQQTMTLLAHNQLSGHGDGAALAPRLAITNNGTLPPNGTTGWFIPGLGQWNLMIKGLMGGDGLRWGWQDCYKLKYVNARLAQAGLSGTPYDPSFAEYNEEDYIDNQYTTTTFMNQDETYQTPYCITTGLPSFSINISFLSIPTRIRSFLAF